MKGKKRPEHSERMKGEGNPMFGVHRYGKEAPMFGKKHTKEAKQKISDNHPDVSGKNHPMYGVTGEDHPMYGKHHTEEAKQKNREAHLGKKNHNYGMTGEKAPMFGKHPSKKTKQKQREAKLGEKNPNWKGGYEKWRARAEQKQRGFGFVPLNNNFIGAEAHHLDKELVLYIPKDLHHSVYHNIHTGQGMKEINNLACGYIYGIEWKGK